MRNAIEKQENGRFWRGDELNKYIYIYNYYTLYNYDTWNMWYTTTMIMVMVKYDIYTQNYITMVIVVDQSWIIHGI